MPIKRQKDELRALNKRSDLNEQELIDEIIETYEDAIEEINDELEALFPVEKVNMAQINSLRRKRVENLTKEEKAILAAFNKKTRLEASREVITREVNRIYATNNEALFMNLGEIYEDNFYTLGFVTETESKVLGAFDFLRQDRIFAAVNTKIDKLKLDQRLNKHRKELIKSLEKQIRISLARNETIAQVSKRIEKQLMVKRGNNVLHGDATKAMRVARTEVGRIKNTARDTAIEQAIDKGLQLVKEWIATLDRRTREDHLVADGQRILPDGTVVASSGVVIAGDGLFHVGGHTAPAPQQFGIAAQDINCRCTVGATFVGLDENLERRVKRQGYATVDKTTGKMTEKEIAGVIDAKTAAEWKNARFKEFADQKSRIEQNKTRRNEVKSLVGSSMKK